MTNAGEFSRISTSKLMEMGIPARLQRLAGHPRNDLARRQAKQEKYSNFDEQTDENGNVLA
jgi:hypothetical protein